MKKYWRTGQRVLYVKIYVKTCSMTVEIESKIRLDLPSVFKGIRGELKLDRN